jgi:hypothetical protein
MERLVHQPGHACHAVDSASQAGSNVTMDVADPLWSPHYGLGEERCSYWRGKLTIMKKVHLSNF